MSEHTLPILELLAYAAAAMIEPIPAPPVVVFEAPAYFQKTVCQGRKRCPVLALYRPDVGIILRSDVDFNSVYARSILLHELVHHVQWHLRGVLAKDCKEWYRREQEATEIQHAYLLEKQRPIRRRMARITCLEDPL